MNEELDSKLESIEKEFLVSESQIIKAKATLSEIAYKRNYWKNDNPPDIDETTLNNIEDGIARAYAALNETRQMLTQANERTGIEQILGFGDNLTNAVNQLNKRTGIEQNLEFGDNLTNAVNQLNKRTGIEQNLEFGDNLTDAVNQLNSNIKIFGFKKIVYSNEHVNVSANIQHRITIVVPDSIISFCVVSKVSAYGGSDNFLSNAGITKDPGNPHQAFIDVTCSVSGNYLIEYILFLS